MARPSSAPAYKLVDLSILTREHQTLVMNDALDGGPLYGVMVVEEMINGAARQPIFGVYNDTPNRDDATRWADALAEFGVEDTTDEEALAAAAKEQADADAAAIAAKEDADLAAISPGGANKIKK